MVKSEFTFDLLFYVMANIPINKLNNDIYRSSFLSRYFNINIQYYEVSLKIIVQFKLCSQKYWILLVWLMHAILSVKISSTLLKCKPVNFWNKKDIFLNDLRELQFQKISRISKSANTTNWITWIDACAFFSIQISFKFKP